MDNNNDFNNNNLDEFLLNNDLDMNLNDRNNDRNENSKWSLYFFIFLISFLLLNEIYYLNNQIKNYIFELNNASELVFERCVKYQSLNELYKSIFFIIFITFLIISSIVFQLNNEEAFQKFFFVLLYFILYLLGPILTGFCTLGIFFYRRICFACDNNDPYTRYFDSYTFLTLICAEFIGINALLIYNNFETKYNLNSSIRFKDNGNYFLGKLFWKATQWRRRTIVENRII